MKNQLTAIVTSAMLIFTTGNLPSYALKAREYSVSGTNLETTSVDNVLNQISSGTGTNKVKGENGEFTIAKRRGRWVRQQVSVCNRRRTYSRRYRRWFIVRLCRTAWRRVYVYY